MWILHFYTSFLLHCLDSKVSGTLLLKFYPISSYRILGWSILSYPILSYRIVSYFILSYPILSYSILFYSILFYSILSYPILSYPILSYPIRCHLMLFCTTLSAAPCFRRQLIGIFIKSFCSIFLTYWEIIALTGTHQP